MNTFFFLKPTYFLEHDSFKIKQYFTIKNMGSSYKVTDLRKRSLWPGAIIRESGTWERQATLLDQLLVDLLESPSSNCCKFQPHYFGPMETLISRNKFLKKMGISVYMYVTRAVYFNVASSLSTNDFLLVLRRFIFILNQFWQRLYHLF